MGRMDLARICVLSTHMANKSDGEFTPQELQRDGQSRRATIDASQASGVVPPVVALS